MGCNGQRKCECVHTRPSNEQLGMLLLLNKRRVGWTNGVGEERCQQLKVSLFLNMYE